MRSRLADHRPSAPPSVALIALARVTPATLHRTGLHRTGQKFVLLSVHKFTARCSLLIMSSTPEPQPQPAAKRDKLDPAVVRLIVILLVGLIPSLLDTTIVNVAIRTVGKDLHTTVYSIQWVITGYLLSFGMVIPISGWALSRFGGRTIWIFSLSVFLIGSIASGAAWSVSSLIAFRVLQGAGGGLMLPLLTTLITQAVGGGQLGRLMAAVSLPVA